MSVHMAQARIKAESVNDVQAATKQMFAAIDAAQPEGIRYASVLLPDGQTFVALLQVDDGAENPIPGVSAVLRAVGMTDRERLLDDLRPVALAIAYGYPEIAGIIGKSQDNVRQLATRARRHVEQRRPRFQATREQRDELARRFFAAAEHGDLSGLEALLAHDVELTGDGGGKVPALAHPLRGRSRVARALIDSVIFGSRIPGVSVRRVEVNDGPGALVLDVQQRLIGVMALDIAGGQIRSISSIVNPDKLTHLGPVGDLQSLLRSAG